MNFGSKYAQFTNEVALDMSVSVEQAEVEWYEVAEQTTYAPKVTAYRERYEALKLQAETRKPAPPIKYTPESTDVVEAPVESDPELRFPGQREELHALPDPAPEPTPTTAPQPEAERKPAMPANKATATQAEIGQRLKQAREKAGWHRAQLEHAIDATAGTLYSVESGFVKKWVPQICALLHINPDWLATGEGTMFLKDPPRAAVPAPRGGAARKARIKGLSPAGKAEEEQRQAPIATPGPVLPRKDPPPAPPLPTATPNAGKWEAILDNQTAYLRLDPQGRRVISITGPLNLSAAELDRVQKWLGLQFLVA